MKPIYQKEIPNYCKRKFEKEIFNKRFGHLRVVGISVEPLVPKDNEIPAS